MGDQTIDDDPTGVPNESAVYRRISPDWYVQDDESGGRRVSSAAFQDKGGYMSVALGSILEQLELEPEEVVANHPGYGLLRFSVHWVRTSLQLGVAARVTEDEPWHGGIFGRKTGAVRKRFVAEGNDWICTPDESV